MLGSDINFRTLLGLLNLFAREVAQAKEVKFLPAYFPFTEPSVEMHVRHPKLGWMELGARDCSALKSRRRSASRCR